MITLLLLALRPDSLCRAYPVRQFPERRATIMAKKETETSNVKEDAKAPDHEDSTGGKLRLAKVKTNIKAGHDSIVSRPVN
jgi:hypothetical protein